MPFEIIYYSRGACGLNQILQWNSQFAVGYLFSPDNKNNMVDMNAGNF